MRDFLYGAGAGLLLAATGASAIELDVNSDASVQNAARAIASNIMTRYQNSSNIVGLFPDPYYYWESGLAWDSMINYASLTGDSQWNDLIIEAIFYQRGPDNAFMPPNQTMSLGNDDQSTWALAAMTAAEKDFPIPQGAPISSWAELAVNVFEAQAARWDNDTCNGGLRWQIFSFNNGYDYKNSFTNGNFLQLAARLSLYTGNQTYLDWAESVFYWSVGVGLIDNRAQVFDGTDTSQNCSQINHIQWTASIGTYLSGSAYAVNDSRTVRWTGRYFALWTSANATFLKEGVMSEVACEPNDNCNTDQLAFKAVLARAYANSRALSIDSTITQGSGCGFNETGPCEDVGSSHEIIQGIIESSAMAAAAQCTGGSSGTLCGSNWLDGYDGSTGLGQDLSALEAILAVLPSYYRSDGGDEGVIGSPGVNETSSAGNGTGPSSPSQSPVPYDNIADKSSASVFALIAAIGFAAAFSM